MAVFPDAYSKVDRARDFITVFSGDQGQRVLAQIATFCRPPSHASNADRPGLLAFHDGQRSVLVQIMKCFDSETREVVTEEKPDAT